MIMNILIQENKLPGSDVIEKFQTAKRLKFDGIELTIFNPPWLKDRIGEISKAIETTGMFPRVLCGGYRGWIGHFDDDLRKKAVTDIIDAMMYCPGLGITGLIAPAAFGMHSNVLPPFSAPRSQEEDQRVLVEGLKRIREAAEKYKVVLLLEPLNRYEDHILNTVEQAVQIIEKVKSPFIKVMGDLFHMSIEESDIAATIRKYASDIKHIHIADSNRYQPGKGHTDFKPVFRALKDIQYEGYISFECRFIGKDRERAIEISLDYIKNCGKNEMSKKSEEERKL